jgi:hypothetical protein
MNGRCVAPLFTVVAVALLVPAGVAGQAQPAAADSWAPSRTSWGEPDLQGVWDYRTITPLQRSPELEGQEFYTEEEAAEFEERNTGSATPVFSWWQDKLELTDDRRTSLIVDPPDGRMPALTPEAQQRVAAMVAVFQRPTHGPEDRALFERCLVGRTTGPPMLPSLVHYDSRIQVFQVPGYVVLFNEMIHETRVVPLDGRPHVPDTIRQWTGDSRGHWEGDTLVVESTNLSDQTNYGGWGLGDPYYRLPLLGANMRVVERFTRVDADTIGYEFTVDDSTTFSKPWSVAMPMRRTDVPLYEFACHEGNRGLEGMIRTTRLDEALAAAEIQGGDVVDAARPAR